MVVVVTLAKPNDADQIVVSAVIGGVKAAISKLWHVADGIDSPSDIVNQEHRNVDAPQHSGETESEEQSGGHRQMRQHVKRRIFP